jgi:hypothetical protein
MTPSVKPTRKFREIPTVQNMHAVERAARARFRRWQPAELAGLPFPVAPKRPGLVRGIARRVVLMRDLRIFFAGFCWAWLMVLGLLLWFAL